MLIKHGGSYWTFGWSLTLSESQLVRRSRAPWSLRSLPSCHSEPLPWTFWGPERLSNFPKVIRLSGGRILSFSRFLTACSKQTIYPETSSATNKCAWKRIIKKKEKEGLKKTKANSIHNRFLPRQVPAFLKAALLLFAVRYRDVQISF